MSWFFSFREEAGTGSKTGKRLERKGAITMEVRNVMDHYEIYRDGAFVCSCDANELDEVLEEMGE